MYTANGRERWKCHAASCPSTGGDSVDFVQQWKGLTRWQAIEELTGESPPKPEARQQPPRPKKKPDLNLIRPLVPFPREHGFRNGGPTPEILTPRYNKRSIWRPQLVHPYKNQRGEVVMFTVRIVKATGGKVVLPVRYDAQDGPISMGWQEGEDRLLYNEPYLRLRPEDPVLLVEGEKCVDAVKALEQFKDYIVLTWQGGSENHRKQPWDRLKGRKVTIWPDADPPKPNKEEGGGVIAARHIAEAIQPAEVRVVWPLQEWIDQDRGYDILDLIGETSADEARQIMENLAVPWQGEEPPNEPPEPPQEPPPPGRDGEPIPYNCASLKNGGGLLVREWNNWWLYVSRDPRFGHVLAYDVFDKVVMVDDKRLDDGVTSHLVEEMQTVCWRGLNPDRLGPILETVARAAPVNRLAEAIQALPWDGVERHLLAYAGVTIEGDEGRWGRVAGWRWLLGLVKRILQPGAKHDLVLVLEGKQGMGKSRFFETVGEICGRNLYTDLARLAQDKDTQMKLIGKCVVELSEMTAHNQSNSDALKGMLTITTDRYRFPYGRHTEEVPRTCVFGGTTNEEKYLKDMTGNRRYLIVAVETTTDIEGLKRDLPQLIAEAVQGLANGEQNWLLPHEETMQEAVARDRELEWPQFLTLERELDDPALIELSREEAWTKAGFHLTKDRTQMLDRALTYVLKRRGFKQVRTAKARLWRRPKLDPDIP